MDKKQSIILCILNVSVVVSFFLLCSQPTKPEEKPRLASVSDLSVFAEDTVRLSVDPLFAPATISGYLWSFDGGKKYSDTTKTNTFFRVWHVRDTGMCTIAAKIFDSRGIVSDSVVFHVMVKTCKPLLSIIADTVVDFIDPCNLSVVNDADCPHVRSFLWSFDGGQTFSDTSSTGTIVKRWNRSDTGKICEVVVRAIGASGIFSEPASLKIHIGYCRPTVNITGDSVVYLGEATRLFITHSMPCSISNYLWSFNNGVFFTDTTFNPSVLRQWQIQDTGIRIVCAAAQTAAGIISPVDTLKIMVRSGDFQVTLPHDTSIFVNDTLLIISGIASAHSMISHYIWSIDNSPQTIMTDSNALASLWTAAQIGIHQITVRAFDVNGHYATSGPMTVTVVAANKPRISVPHDTLLRAKDTVIATVSASTDNAKIIRYLWNVGSLSWTDSSALPQRKIWRQGRDTVSVMVGARDEYGNCGIDSFHVFFNAPPANLHMLSPGDHDTICVRLIDSTFARGIVPFTFSASDRNGISDSLTYKLSLGKASDSLVEIYEGRDSTCLSPRLDTARYYWTLVVRDKLGDSAFISGSFNCLLQHTLCFAGHSIIVGWGGSSDSGGIRKKVLSTLRSRKGCEAKVKSIGPLPTGFLKEKKDDSCLAVSSYRARDVFLLMRNNFPTLAADMWVVMLGVNDRYTMSELQYLISLLDLIHGNNPQAYTYVINGLPYAPLYGQDTVFNKWLADSISLRQQNRHIYAINAYKLFSVNNAPNPDLYEDVIPYLHPNQKGYDSLAQMVLDTMSRYAP